MATIPEMRPILLQIADRLPYASLPERVQMADQLRVIEAELHRRKVFRKAPATSTPMTPALEKRIRAYAKRHPTASQQDIAVAHGVIAARVSVALRGPRT